MPLFLLVLWHLVERGPMRDISRLGFMDFPILRVRQWNCLLPLLWDSAFGVLACWELCLTDVCYRTLLWWARGKGYRR